MLLKKKVVTSVAFVPHEGLLERWKKVYFTSHLDIFTCFYHDFIKSFSVTTSRMLLTHPAVWNGTTSGVRKKGCMSGYQRCRKTSLISWRACVCLCMRAHLHACAPACVAGVVSRLVLPLLYKGFALQVARTLGWQDIQNETSLAETVHPHSSCSRIRYADLFTSWIFVEKWDQTNVNSPFFKCLLKHLSQKFTFIEFSLEMWNVTDSAFTM